MKLHAFDTEKEGERFRAFTRDKARRSLKKAVFVSRTNQRIQPHEWTYVGIMSTTGVDSEHIKALHHKIRADGFAIVSMAPIIRHFFVFELQLDVADLRIYSADRELKEFNAARHLMEMRPEGDSFKGSEPLIIGEVDIPDAKSAKAMGLNYENLQEKGFDVAVVRTSSYEEAFRRAIEREVPKSFSKLEERLGIQITDFKIHDIRFQEEEEFPLKAKEAQRESTTSEKIEVRLENSTTINNVVSDKTRSENGIFDWWLLKLVGLLAAVVTLIVYFNI